MDTVTDTGADNHKRGQIMFVELKRLQPNPMRDFRIDPIDPERVEALTKSINDDGFWGGIVCRRLKDGTIQIGAGHHRVNAALKAGITKADVFIGEEFDDARMVRVYAVENATQRGNSGTALAGSIAAAIRITAKAALTGTVLKTGSGNFSRSSLDEVRGNLGSERGIGRDVLLAFLDGVPGINEGVVKQQLASLKDSGDYARIIRELQAEIEEENKAALKALERAERERREADERAAKAEAERKEAAARAKAAREDAERKRAALEQQRAEAEAKLAAKRQREAEAELKKFDALRKTRDTAAKAADTASAKEITFDFEGVAKHLDNANQIDVFRKMVTGDGIKPYLPVNRQAQLAKHLVDLAKKNGDRELSGAFIRENLTTLVLGVKSAERKATREEQEELRRQDLVIRAKAYQADFARSCRTMAASGLKLQELMEKWPKGLALPITGEFRDALKAAKTIITTLDRRL